MVSREESSAPSALIRADQPWGDAVLARLYDAFPFAADLSLYLELAAAQGGRVLDVACGSGRVLVPLAQAGHQVTGVDASAHMLAVAREKLVAAGSDAGANARLVQGDMRSFQLDERFDLAVIAVKSFAYLTERTDQEQTLARVAAHLRPGGQQAI
jgi:ubiquinone/menaquinone biosynthesis C-methylase UbiE